VCSSDLLLSNYALTRMEASRMSIFQHLSTVISILAGILFLDETLSPVQVLGAVLIVAGVMGTQKRTRSFGADTAGSLKKD
jgi:drug/metabolite transporter (DMT)-like permease